MAVRFIIGRAGSGKTHHCLDAIRERLLQDAVDGPRLILLVPEQAALQMERAVQAPSGDAQPAMALAGAHRAEILSFRRLAFRVLEQAGGPVRQALTEPACAMVLRHLVAQCGRQLRYYRSGRASHISGGFVECMLTPTRSCGTSDPVNADGEIMLVLRHSSQACRSATSASLPFL